MTIVKPQPRASRIGPETPLLLASASAGRSAVLRGASLNFRQEPAKLDERALEAEARRNGAIDAGRLAMLLAEAKARAVSRLHPEALVIGADQVMACGGEQLSKPPTIEAARGQLRFLRGRTHSLHSAVALAWAGEPLWRHVGRADLTMRVFSEAFLASYLAAEGEAVLGSVGGYRIEGLGIQLFSEVEGDHFTIIGLPLLPLLDYLREIGWLPA
jgi:septum formation protein